MTYVSDFHRNPTGGVEANLTEEQRSRIDQDAPCFWDIGFIHPNQITGYDCKKCGRVERKPAAQANIGDFADGPQATVTYLCNCGEVIVCGALIPTERISTIPPEFIKYDPTGEYRTPTAADIEELLQEIVEDAMKGWSLKFDHPRLKVLETWAEKIGYGLPKDRLEAIAKTCRESYIAKAPERLAEAVEKLYNKDWMFSLGEVDNRGCAYELAEDDVMLVRALLPLVPVPDKGLCEKINYIFSALEEMFKDHQKRLCEEDEEIKQEMADTAEDLEKTRRERVEFLERVAGLNEERREFQRMIQDEEPESEPDDS